MRIDAHNHFWKYNQVRDTWITDDMSVLRKDYLPCEFSKTLEANKIDGAIAVQADQSEEETHFLLKLADASPRILGVVGWVDLRAKEITTRLEKLSAFKKLVGFRHIVQDEPNPDFLRGKEFQRGIAALEQNGFTYDILIFPSQLRAASHLVQQFPNQHFVIDHMAKPNIAKGEIADWQTEISSIAQHPKVYCKLSGIITEADWSTWSYQEIKPYLDVTIEVFGTDRVMFGSDWPVCLLAGKYAQVLQILETYFADFSEAEKEKVFGGNAANFYKIS